MLKVTICMIAVLGLMACSKAEKAKTPDLPIGKAATLKAFASCNELESTIKEIVKNKLENGNLYCGGDIVYDMPTTTPSDPTSSPDMLGEAGDGSSSPVQFTDTNIQEAGIDESDIVKTDGTHVFALGTSKLHIAKAWPAADFGEVASVDIEGTPKSLYIKDNTVVVFSTMYSSDIFDKDETDTYNYCQNGVTKVTLIDVRSINAPSILRETYLEGSIVSDRRIDNMLYIVMSANIRTDFLNTGTSDYDQDYDVALSENKALAEAATLNDFLPRRYTKAKKVVALEASFDINTTTTCGNYNFSEDTKGSSLTQIVTIDLGTPLADESSVVILGSKGTVYASDKSIFIASPTQNSWWLDGAYSDETAIHRFAVDDEGKLPTYFGGRIIPGHMLNQFSMGEYEGFLRVATTVNVMGQQENSVNNNVFVLDSNSTDLPIKGAVQEIAGGERIYAVRFIRDRGFVVTFRQVDPLFVIDLSDPVKPSLTGELKVPGYSTYLHPFDDGTLIGLGRGVEAMNDFVVNEGLQLSLFDVSNASSPSALEQIEIGSAGTGSEALDDHHAFTFDAGRSLLALPVELYEDSSGGNNYGTFKYAGLQLYKVSKTGGFELQGVIKLSSSASGSYYYGGETVRRSIIIGDDSDSGIIIMNNNGMSLYKLNETMNKAGAIEFDDVADTGAIEYEASIL